MPFYRMLRKYFVDRGPKTIFSLFKRLRRVNAFTLAALGCCVLAIRMLLSRASHPLNGYDEALLFLNAQMMADGRVIYRDFYSNYPPAMFQLVRAIAALGLPTIWTMRSLTILVHVGTALIAGRLVA